ncbi:MAG TPA: squalene/phytoene synthase family protein [Planctomycetota bacterium]|nr:squalene/phytoene synthase family protein [Planctomycetota bacterium]
MSSVVPQPITAAMRPEEITARSGSSFTTAFVCLDRARREGMTAIYAFCRVADDAVDEAGDAATGRAHLQFWRAELAAVANGKGTTPVGQALQTAMRRFGVEVRPLHDLLDGVEMDLAPHDFADEAELRCYCYRVASAVGLACLPVLGATGAEASRFADALGKALQFTNILRDLRFDAELGRCYAPQTWLAETGVERAWLAGAGPSSVYASDGPVAALCARLAQKAADEFAVARAALRLLPRRQRRALVPARIMGAIYGDLLRRLVQRGGDLRGARMRVTRPKKAWLALLVLAGVDA